MAFVVNRIAPPRLGRDFRWLLSSSLVNNAGDGIVLAAGPLLVASQTHDPFLVSLAVTFEYLPWMLFGLVGGVAADRFNRRLLVIGANLVRALVLVGLVLTIATGSVSIALVLGAILALATPAVRSWSSPEGANRGRPNRLPATVAWPGRLVDAPSAMGLEWTEHGDQRA